ncbi:hypothetical protein HY628_00820 [Candidatus Uhrbacteria bacterium]|nr:hypothetical protein [Candidatus Uhrbacteria bacterium]
MPKTLVTHVNPHLDDIAGIWLFRKFAPGWQGARLKFIPTTAAGAKWGKRKVDADPEIAHIGVGRGKYDEHKGNLNESAATLVFKDLQKRKLLPKGVLPALRAALQYVLEGDLGLRGSDPDAIFEIAIIVRYIPDSEERVKIGCVLLEALLTAMEDRLKLDHDWQWKEIFETPWGRGVGIVSGSRAADRAYQEGFVVIIQIDPEKKYRSIRGQATSNVDLAEAYGKVRKLEPKADWYLHHSKRMLICGSDAAPKSQRSKLTLKELIALIKN